MSLFVFLLWLLQNLGSKDRHTTKLWNSFKSQQESIVLFIKLKYGFQFSLVLIWTSLLLKESVITLCSVKNKWVQTNENLNQKLY